MIGEKVSNSHLQKADLLTTEAKVCMEINFMFDFALE